MNAQFVVFHIGTGKILRCGHCPRETILLQTGDDPDLKVIEVDTHYDPARYRVENEAIIPIS